MGGSLDADQNRDMTKPKPLPYRANYLKDMALMDFSEVLEVLIGFIEQVLTPEEQMRRVGKSIHLLHEGIYKLKEIDGVER